MDTISTTRTGMIVHHHGLEAGPTLVLMHGITDAGSCWPDALARWSARWRILALDLRGHGGSPRFAPDDRANADRVWTRDVVSLLEEEARPPILIGHSNGGRVAVEVGLARPDLVRALVLEDPACAADSADSPWFNAEQRSMLDGFASRAESERARMLVESGWSEAEVDGWVASKIAADADLYDGLVLHSLNPGAPLSRLRVETLVLYDADGVFASDPRPDDNPLVTRVDLEGVGHCIRRDDPQGYHRIVDPWIDARR